MPELSSTTPSSCVAAPLQLPVDLRHLPASLSMALSEGLEPQTDEHGKMSSTWGLCTHVHFVKACLGAQSNSSQQWRFSPPPGDSTAIAASGGHSPASCLPEIACTKDPLFSYVRLVWDPRQVIAMVAGLPLAFQKGSVALRVAPSRLNAIGEY